MNVNGTDGIRLTWAAIAIIVTMALNLVVAVFGYGKLNATVNMGFANTNERISTLQSNVQQVTERQRITDIEVAQLKAARTRRAQ